MCLALYLFTDNKMEEIVFDKENPGLFLREIMEREYAVKNWVADKPHIYYVGSSQGCGCGWEAALESDEEEEIAEKTKDRQALHQLLASQNFAGSHLIICWEGDQGDELERPDKVSLAQIRDVNFEFEECVDYQIE